MENVENGAQPQLSKRAQIANPFRAMVFGAMADEMIADGTDVVKLSLGEPDFGAPARPVRDAMREQYDGRPLAVHRGDGACRNWRQAISVSIRNVTTSTSTPKTHRDYRRRFDGTAAVRRADGQR